MPNLSIAWLDQVDSEDSYSIGEHAARLGSLIKAGIPIPDGFIITPFAFNSFLIENNLAVKTKHLISTVNFNDPNSLKQVSHLIRKYFTDGNLSSEFRLEIYNAYKKLSGAFSDNQLSLILTPIMENAGLFREKNVTQVKGESSLISKILDSWASNYTELNIIHNHHNQDFIKSIVVQKDIDPEKSGKVYTIDSANHDNNKLVIKAVHGSYEDDLNFVTMPDYYTVDKNESKLTAAELIPQIKMSKKSGDQKNTINLPRQLRTKQKLLQNEIDELVRIAKLVEKYHYFPQEIDWSIEKGKIYFTHSKPITSFV